MLGKVQVIVYIYVMVLWQSVHFLNCQGSQHRRLMNISTISLSFYFNILFNQFVSNSTIVYGKAAGRQDIRETGLSGLTGLTSLTGRIDRREKSPIDLV